MRILLAGALLSTLVSLTGCGDTVELRSYTVRRELDQLMVDMGKPADSVKSEGSTLENRGARVVNLETLGGDEVFVTREKSGVIKTTVFIKGSMISLVDGVCRSVGSRSKSNAANCKWLSEEEWRSIFNTSLDFAAANTNAT